MITRRNFIKTAAAGAGMMMAPILFQRCRSECRLPNIVYILADDLGYGDISIFNPGSRIHTPNIDELARQGMRFTDAHAGSAVCSPTRYGILTGRYAWRTRLKSGVLTGFSPALIERGRLTVASMLKERGYSTACIGKWHLGWDWQTTDGSMFNDEWNETGEHVDYSKPIQNGPTSLGFDYFLGIPASLDMLPYVYVENDHVVEAPTETIEGTSGYEFYRGGPIAPGFRHEEVLPFCTEKAVSYIRHQAQEAPDQPFFLYVPLTAPHTPILPTEDFKGKTGIGPYGDFVAQCDWTVGRVVNVLKESGLLDHTLVIFTSDNGCSPMADFQDLAQKGHHPSHHFRGYKADIFEGGHRIPFIAHWPGTIPAGASCDDTVCLTDLMATAAAIAGTDLPNDAAEDSYNILPDILGQSTEPIREATVHHSINGSFSIRQGKWKLQLCPGSGGWSNPTPEEARKRGLPPVQLYDLEQDVGETVNVYDRYPDVVRHLSRLLELYRENGRSVPLRR